jgi:protocatechuate 3,4-dioxygenase beta subunit
VYLHTDDSSGKQDKQDKNFQGYGKFLTGSSGEYYFRTIKPVPYPGRTPHIHFKITKGRGHLLTTQMYIKGHPGNPKDRIWRAVPEGKLRDAITVDFEKVKNSKIGEQAAHFVIVVGMTPGE